MAKKKKRKKSVYRQQKKRASQNSVVAQPAVESSSQKTSLDKQATVEKSASVSPLAGMDVMKTTGLRARHEAKHSLILAAVLLVGLILLWILFANTGLGAQVYHLIKL